ncbi:hypothetical protein [Candidatus Similichlamydia epinepheli]|uniref:hypothetical protein n=1 Tax=Candidatus Similichlamydia epinepheli TaxID=1903953 RepID=UPI00130089F1|nr:hypothetical protein [Candidatus Similichlamydia epinepheli]
MTKCTNNTQSFAPLSTEEVNEKSFSLLELPSLEIEKRIDVLPLPKNLSKFLYRSGFLRIRDILDQHNFLSLQGSLAPSDWECLRNELEKRSVLKRTFLFENKKLLVLILTELTTCSSPQGIDSLLDEELIKISSYLVDQTASLSPSTYVALVRWLENVLQTVTNHLLVPWLRERGGIGTIEEINYWMSLRSEEPSLGPVLKDVLVRGFMWDSFIWGPYLHAVKLKWLEGVIWYVIGRDKVQFLHDLFELLNLCFYKRGQLYKFDYVLQLIQREVAPQGVELRGLLPRLFASIPGLRMVRTPDCLLVEKTGSSGFFLDQ